MKVSKWCPRIWFGALRKMKTGTRCVRLKLEVCENEFGLQNNKNAGALLKLLCSVLDMRGVLGREAPQNTSHFNVTSHKGSKELGEVFVFCNQTHFHTIQVSILHIEFQSSFFEVLQIKFGGNPFWNLHLSSFAHRFSLKTVLNCIKGLRNKIAR